MSRRGLRAFVDESGSHTTQDPDTYLLAASVCRDDLLEDIRAALRPLRLGNGKLHWHQEDARRRRLIAEAIADMDLAHVVVVRSGAPDERGERRRRLCLERLLHELESLGVASALFESRGPADDRRDRKMVEALRTSRAISAAVRVNHEKGPLEPLLWLPDAICGAVVADRIGQGEYLKIIAERVSVTVHDVHR